MYKILALPIIDVSAKITKLFFYKLGLIMVSLLYMSVYCIYCNVLIHGLKYQNNIIEVSI